MSPVSPAAEEIRAFRKARGWTQAEFANRLGVSKRSVEEWEGGRTAAPAMLQLALKALAEGW